MLPISEGIFAVKTLLERSNISRREVEVRTSDSVLCEPCIGIDPLNPLLDRFKLVRVSDAKRPGKIGPVSVFKLRSSTDSFGYVPKTEGSKPVKEVLRNFRLIKFLKLDKLSGYGPDRAFELKSMFSTFCPQFRSTVRSTVSRLLLRSRDVHELMDVGKGPDKELEERFKIFNVVEFIFGNDPEMKMKLDTANQTMHSKLYLDQFYKKKVNIRENENQ